MIKYGDLDPTTEIIFTVNSRNVTVKLMDEVLQLYVILPKTGSLRYKFKCFEKNTLIGLTVKFLVSF